MILTLEKPNQRTSNRCSERYLKGDEMFKSKLVTISSRFDSGDFTGSFAVHAITDGYDIYETSIQKSMVCHMQSLMY